MTQRTAALIRLGLRHPHARSHVLEFDRIRLCDSQKLIVDMRAAGGLPQLAADIVELLSSAPPTSRELSVGQSGVVGGRLVCVTGARGTSLELASTPHYSSDLAVDFRIAKSVVQTVGLLARSESFLALRSLTQAVKDASADRNASAYMRATWAADVLDPVQRVHVILPTFDENGLLYEAPTIRTNWDAAEVSPLLAAWIHLLRNRLILRHLSPWTALPTTEGVWLCCDGIRRIPQTAVSAGNALISAASGHSASSMALIDHMRSVSSGAKSAPQFAEAAIAAVGRSGAELRPYLSTAGPPSPISSPIDLEEVEEPLATALVVAQAVFLARCIRQ